MDERDFRAWPTNLETKLERRAREVHDALICDLDIIPNPRCAEPGVRAQRHPAKNGVGIRLF